MAAGSGGPRLPVPDSAHGRRKCGMCVKQAGRGAQKTEPVGRQWSPGEAETVSGELALRCVGSRGEGSRADSQLLASVRRVSRLGS